MASLAHPLHRLYMLDWERCYLSAVFSGITGDQAHKKRNSYHNGIEDNPIRFGFSNQRPDDRVPPGKWPDNLSAAGDMSMSKTHMVKDYKRMLVVFKDKTDPRRKYLNAYNGWDGVGDAKRVDFVANTITSASVDHTWHAHEEYKRRYIGVKLAHDAVLSIHQGLTKAQWIKSQKATLPPAKPLPPPVKGPLLMEKFIVFEDTTPATNRHLAILEDNGNRFHVPLTDDEAHVLVNHHKIPLVTGISNVSAFGPERVEKPVPPVE